MKCLQKVGHKTFWGHFTDGRSTYPDNGKCVTYPHQTSSGNIKIIIFERISGKMRELTAIDVVKYDKKIETFVSQGYR